MKKFKKIFGSALAAVLLSLSIKTTEATEFLFDGTDSGFSLAETVNYLEIPGADLPGPSAISAAGARTYDFKLLYHDLGYPSPDYFGSNETEVTDLDSYTSKQDAFYEEINGYLRFYPKPYDWYGTGPEDARVIVRNIDRVFDRVPSLPANLILFRGLDLKFRADKSYAIGEEFTDKGYVSTSVSFKVARYFAIEINDNAVTGSRKAVFALYMDRPGEKGILIDQGEDEVILRHGRKYKVMAKKDNVVKYDLYLVQACSAACSETLAAEVRAFWSGFNVQD